MFIHSNRLTAYDCCEEHDSTKVGAIKTIRLGTYVDSIYNIKHYEDPRDYFIFNIFGGYGSIPSGLSKYIRYEITRMCYDVILVDAYIDILDKEGTVDFIDDSEAEEEQEGE